MHTISVQASDFDEMELFDPSTAQGSPLMMPTNISQGSDDWRTTPSSSTGTAATSHDFSRIPTPTDLQYPSTIGTVRRQRLVLVPANPAAKRSPFKFNARPSFAPTFRSSPLKRQPLAAPSCPPAAKRSPFKLNARPSFAPAFRSSPLKRQHLATLSSPRRVLQRSIEKQSAAEPLSSVPLASGQPDMLLLSQFSGRTAAETLKANTKNKGSVSAHKIVADMAAERTAHLKKAEQAVAENHSAKREIHLLKISQLKAKMEQDLQVHQLQVQLLQLSVRNKELKQELLLKQLDDC